MVEISLPGSLIPSVVAFFSSSRSCALGGGFFSRFLTIFLFEENVKFNRIPEVVLSLFESSFKPRSTARLLRGNGSLNSRKNLSGRSYPSVKFEHFDEKMLTELSLIRCRVSLAHLFLPWPEVSVSLLGASLHHSDNLSNLTTRGSSWFLQAIIEAAVIQHCDGVRSQSDKEILQFSESHDRVNVEALPEVLSKRDMVAVPSLCK